MRTVAWLSSLLVSSGCFADAGVASEGTDASTGATQGTTSMTTATATSAGTTTDATSTSSSGTGTDATSAPTAGSSGGDTGSSGTCGDPCYEPGEFLWQTEVFGNSFITDMHTHSSGLTYVCASASGSFDLAGVTVGGDGDSNIVVARMDPDGVFDWAISRGGPDEEFCTSVYANAMGYVAVAGLFFGVGEFGSDPFPDAGGDLGGVVAIVDGSNGDTLRAEPFVVAASGFSVSLSGPVAMNSSDDVLMTVSYASSMAFAGNDYVPTAGNDMLYTRFDFDGENVVTFNDTLGEIAGGVVAAAGGVYQAGEFSGQLTMGGQVLVADGIDTFVARGNELWGTVSWTARTDASGDESVGWFGVDGMGNAYVAGTFTEQVSLDGLNQVEVATELQDVWLAKISSSGAPLWLKAFGGLGEDVPRNLAVNADGDVVITGEYATSIDFGGQSHTALGGDSDAFVAKFDTDGVLQWSRSGGGAGTDRALGTELAPDGSVYVAYSFFADAEFGGDEIVVEDGNASLIVKYAP